MILFDAREDIKNRRKVVLNGRVVTIIDLAGSQAKVAEDGKWYPHKMFFPLTQENMTKEHIEKIKSLVAGKTISTVKPEGTGVQLILGDNTRLYVGYDKNGKGIFFSVLDSDGTKVL